MSLFPKSHQDSSVYELHRIIIAVNVAAVHRLQQYDSSTKHAEPIHPLQSMVLL